jgi:glycosyltransferase involved in cell wall biosynthesis
MRLLVLCPYYPPHIGGVESFASQLNDAVARDSSVSSILVLTARYPVDSPSEERAGKVTILRYPAVEPIANFPVPAFWKRSYWEIVGRAKQHRPSIVFSHTRFFVSSLVAYRVSRSLKKRWIHIEHGSDFVQSSNMMVAGISRLYDQVFGRFVLKNADAVVAISQAVARFVFLLSKRESAVIYRGVDQRLIQTAPPDSKVRSLHPGKILVTYIGRLIEGKGLLDLIDAINLLENSSVVVLIVGAGPQEGELKSVVSQAGLARQVKFLGAKSPIEALGALKASDIFVNPSYTEGLPTTVIEAALCQKPIIATDVGGTNEIIRNNITGLLVAPRQPNDLAEALRRLIDDSSLRKNMGTKAAAEARKKFDWKKSAQEFLSLSNQVEGAS